MADTITEDIVYLSHKTWRIAAGTDLEALFLPASFHGARRYMPNLGGMGGSSPALLSYEPCKLQ